MDNFIEFFQNQPTVLGKYLYVIYSSCGAICYENFVPFKFKCFVIAYICIAYLDCTIPLLRWLIRDSKLEHHFNVFGFMSFITHKVINILLFYRKKKEFRRLFDLINGNSDESIPCAVADSNSEEDYIKETNILRMWLRICQSFIVWMLILYFGKISQKMIFYKNLSEVSEDESEFFIPFFCNACNTTLSFMLAYNASYLSIAPFGLFYYATVCLFIMVSIYFKNQAIGLRNDIKYYSETAFERFEDLDRLEEQELKRRHPSSVQLRDIAEHRETQVQEFKKNVYRWIRIHQRLVECADQYQKCVKIILDLVIGLSWIGIIDLYYFCANFLLDDGNFIQEYFIYLVEHLVVLTVCCNLGNIFHDMSEMISDAIYSTPWYHLPTKEQKDILNFLTLSQRTQTLYIFGVFELTLEFLPTILNEAYGYVGIMRLLVMRSKK